MSNEIKSGKVTLDVEIKDLLNIVSKSNAKPVLSESLAHAIESEDLKKAWFRHTLQSLEKLNDLIETVRRVDIANLKSDMKEEIKRVDSKVDKVEGNIKETNAGISDRITILENDLRMYKDDVSNMFISKDKELQEYKDNIKENAIEPIKTKVLSLTIKLGIWATIGGFVGSSLLAFILYMLRQYLLKSFITKGP
jgi:oligoendopeptidase F